jgi:hypothetical protein
VLALFAKKLRPEISVPEQNLQACRRVLSDVIQLALPFLNYGDARGVSVAAVTREILEFFKDALKLSREEAWIAQQFDKQVLGAVFKCYKFPPDHDFSHSEDVCVFVCVARRPVAWRCGARGCVAPGSCACACACVRVCARMSTNWCWCGLVLVVLLLVAAVVVVVRVMVVVLVAFGGASGRCLPWITPRLRDPCVRP